MKKITCYFILFIFSCTLPALAQQKFKPLPEWLRTATFYQIYPQSFKDTNGDGIGDINGITEKLDYMKWLGIDALWLNPCFESEFQDAGYDVTDFYKVASRYGTNDDLKKLFLEAKKRDMKVCLDLVAGHTSDKHSWFLESKKKKKNEFSDRYVWTNDSTYRPEKKYVTAKYERNGAYRKNFFNCQPALNYGFGQPNKDHSWEQPVTAEGPQKTRRELMKIMDFWMDMGADGFRVDMAHSLIKNDPDYEETNKLWYEVRTHFQDKYPEGIIIAEWGDPAKAIKAGFMFDFIIHLRNKGYSSLFFNKVGTYTQDTCYFSLEGNGTPALFRDYFIKQLAAVGNEGYTCIPTSNHDFQRPNSGNRNTEEQLKVAMTFFMTMPGIPLIYYGDEIGMKYIPGLPNKEGSLLTKGNRAGSRTPMQWDASDKAGFSTADPASFYLPLDPYEFRPNVENQIGDPASMINFTRNLIALRKQHEALASRGDIELLYAEESSYPLVFKRLMGDECFIVVLNPSAKRHSAFVKMPEQIKKMTPIMVNKTIIDCKPEGISIRAEGVSYGIFKVEK